MSGSVRSVSSQITWQGELKPVKHIVEYETRHRCGQVTLVCPTVWQMPQDRGFLAAGGLLKGAAPLPLPLPLPSPLGNPPPKAPDWVEAQMELSKEHWAIGRVSLIGMSALAKLPEHWIGRKLNIVFRQLLNIFGKYCCVKVTEIKSMMF